jgi:predicted component of type VI protein secretion system
MFLLRLFDRANPALPVGAHMLRDGTTIVGRDPAADWPIADADCEISRHHLEFAYHDGKLVLRPLGANGVFLEGGDGRLPDGEEVSLALGDALTFGKYRLVVDSIPFPARSGASFERTMVFAAPFGEKKEVPTEWPDEAAEFAPHDDQGSLLEAFCAGAKLDVSALSAEEPAEIMRRAGAIYRQMVLGLGDLVSERSIAKADLRMDRTTIDARDNNPFKWAPSRRLATDLLLGQETGFLSGPDAIKASFEDLKQHMLGTLSGFAAALRALLDRISPAAIDKGLDGQSRFLKSRPALAWAEYEKAHAELQAQVLENRAGPISAAFAAAYEQSLDEAAPRGLEPPAPSAGAS